MKRVLKSVAISLIVAIFPKIYKAKITFNLFLINFQITNSKLQAQELNLLFPNQEHPQRQELSLLFDTLYLSLSFICSSVLRWAPFLVWAWPVLEFQVLQACKWECVHPLWACTGNFFYIKIRVLLNFV